MVPGTGIWLNNSMAYCTFEPKGNPLQRFIDRLQANAERLIRIRPVDEVPGGGWTVRVYHKPLVNWIWGGALLMAIGGGFAVTDRRYALASRKRTSETPTGKPEQVSRVVTSAATSAIE